MRGMGKDIYSIVGRTLQFHMEAIVWSIEVQYHPLQTDPALFFCIDGPLYVLPHDIIA